MAKNRPAPMQLQSASAAIIELAASGVPIVVIPLCNPKAYRSNWRYPNTSERDWHKGGYSVGDAEYLLPDLTNPARSRVRRDRPRPRHASPDRSSCCTWPSTYPPRLVLDLHEDELSTDGGYIYSQGSPARRIIQSAPRSSACCRSPAFRSGSPGRTRFTSRSSTAVISRDDRGQT